MTLDSDLSTIRSFPTSAPPCEATATDLAYVMYTSGSTGRPKGTMIPHRGVVRLVKNTNYAVFTEEDVFLQFAPVSFDASTFEIWGPLLNGGRLVLMPAEHHGLDALGRAIQQHGVTTLWLSAGLFNLMVDERLDDLRGLKQLLSGGDVLSVTHVKRAYTNLPDCRIINGYGPTENTTFTCCHTVEAADLAGSPIPIGVPIANTQVYVLDSNLQPVPHGAIGELYTGGDGLARGYLNRADLTAEKFIPNPFSIDPEARLYKTGDQCRSREDGTFEFLGRTDDQIKVRGFRIELGEIESCLAGHPTVRQCVVVAVGESLENKRLAAYYTVHPNTTVTAESLNAYLTSRLPSHMVPSALIRLQALPLTSHGKIDRKALPSTTSHPTFPESNEHHPLNPEEQKMAALWAQTLRVKQVGRHDNFFALGGNSLLALKLFEKIHQSFSCQLPLASLFEFPTVSQLVQLLHSREDHQRLRTSLVKIRPEGTLAPFFCVHGGGGEVLFGRDLARSLHLGIPFYGLQAQGLENPAERHHSIEEMAAHYLETIQSVIAEGPIYLGGYCMGGLVAYEMARRLHGQGLQVKKLILIDTHNPVQVAKWQEHMTPRSLWIQKIGFQIGNMIRLSPRKQLRYFFKRSHAAATRRFVWLWNTVTSFLSGKAHSQEHTSVDSVRNEGFSAQISERYLPKPIDVDTVLFRPEGSFRGLDDPKMGWGDLIQGKLEVVMIPVNPGGMLVEPFIGILGQEISKRLADTPAATDRS